MRKILTVLVPVVLLSACSWGITLNPAAKNVRTAWNGNVSACRDLGKVTVSVMDRVGPVDRNNITVRDELEVMARNQAADMHADTIKPLAEPVGGSQAWGVYECGTRALNASGTDIGRPAQPARASSSVEVQTFPVKGG